LTIFAASSLQPSLTTVADAWQAQTGRRVVISYASSAALARQISQGAPADIFVSADREWMDWAEQNRLIRAETRRDLLGNALVLIAPAASTLSLTVEPGAPLMASLGTGRLAMGDPRSVPVGRYAEAALTTLGLWPELRSRIAGADSARAALALVARGEAPLGIVFQTDARREPRVRVVARFPPNSHPPIIYPFALTAASRSADAGPFLDYVSSMPAAALFAADGFVLLP
jgi:molybdate transport system substrate-binding protein